MDEAPVEIVTGGQVTASVIWLHGLGADGHDFEPVVGELRRSGARGVRFIFPHAPVRPITLNGGMPMRGWFDIKDLSGAAPSDEAGLRESEGLVRRLIDNENSRGVPPERVIVAGFSQGGATALHVVQRYPRRLAGVIGLSCWLPPLAGGADAEGAARHTLPIFMAHGSYDPVVPLQLGRAARDCLQGLGHQVAWREYPMEHAVCMEEIAAIDAWLAEVLSSS